MSQFDPRDPRQPFTGRTPGQGEKEQESFEQDGPIGNVGRRFWYRTSQDKARLKRYLEAEALLDPAEHYKLFSMLGPEIDPPAEEQWIEIDWPGMLARLMRHYALGPNFSVRASRTGTDSAVQRTFKRGRFVQRLREGAEALPVFGDVVFRIDIEDIVGEDGESVPVAMPKFIHPGNYHPEFDPVDATRVVRATLAWVLPNPVDQRRSTMPFVVLKEIHDPGSVRFEAVEWDGVGKEGRPVSVETIDPGLESGETGIQEIPIVHVPFNAAGGVPWGRSEFRRIKRIFLALENRMSQLDEILERHARPKLIVGPGLMDPNARARLADFDVIEIDPSIMEKAVKPEYLTWDPQIQAIGKQLEKLEEYFFITTETSPASFGLERDGSQVESARALRFKAHRTINKVEDLRDTLRPAVEDLFRISQAMENAAREDDGMDTYSPSPVNVFFPDPIIEDDTQEAQDYALLKTAGLVSRKRAVSDLHDLDPAQAEAEVREILQDMTDEQAATPAPAPVETTLGDGEVA